MLLYGVCQQTSSPEAQHSISKAKSLLQRTSCALLSLLASPCLKCPGVAPHIRSPTHHTVTTPRGPWSAGQAASDSLRQILPPQWPGWSPLNRGLALRPLAVKAPHNGLLRPPGFTTVGLCDAHTALRVPAPTCASLILPYTTGTSQHHRCRTSTPMVPHPQSHAPFTACWAWSPPPLGTSSSVFLPVLARNPGVGLPA